MSPPRVSVVMTTYNGERFLSEAIECILNQSFTDLELIVVDDGSIDSSASIIRSFCARDLRVRGIFLERNLGIPKAANRGLEAARGEYVARMDSDDQCHRDRLLKQVCYLDKHKKIQIVGCHFRAIDEEGFFCSDAYARRFKQSIPLSFGRHRVAKDLLHQNYSILHPAILCRRSCYISLGGYREIFFIGEDTDFFLRLVISHGAVLDNLSEKLHYHRHYGSSTTVRFTRHVHIFIACVLPLFSEFRRRGFWDPLDECPSVYCKSLRFRGISSFLFLQDSLVFLPVCPRVRLYHLLRVVVILRRFGLKDFHDISLWEELGITLDKQIYFYVSFCMLCFRAEKFRAGFLYLRHILSLRYYVIFFEIFKILKYLSDNHLRSFRSLIFTQRFYHGLKHLVFAFLLNPFHATKFFLIRFFVHSFRIVHIFYRKLGF